MEPELIISTQIMTLFTTLKIILDVKGSVYFKPKETIVYKKHFKVCIQWAGYQGSIQYNRFLVSSKCFLGSTQTKTQIFIS